MNNISHRNIIIFGEITKPGLLDYTQHLEAALKNDSIKVIYFKINSRGGYSGPEGNALSEKIFESRSRKLIVAIANGWCTSAAYNIAASCHEIWAMPGSFIGGIGTIFDRDSPFEQRPPIPPLTQPERDYMQAFFSKSLDENLQIMSENFIQRVARYRSLSDAHIRCVAEGKAVYKSNTALKLGLIDFIYFNSPEEKSEDNTCTVRTEKS